MAGVNTIQILYIAFRLAPFIIVSYFALNSLMNFTIRGIIYLIGLLMVSFFTVIVSGLMPNVGGFVSSNPTCNIITLTGNIAVPLSQIPLSLTVYSYTLSYILTSVLLNVKVSKGEKMSLTNIPTIILFCLLIIAEFMSSMVSGCFSITNGVAALVLGMLGGMAWGAIIYYQGSPDMTFYSTSADICTRPSNLKYQCKKQPPMG